MYIITSYRKSKHNGFGAVPAGPIGSIAGGAIGSVIPGVGTMLGASMGGAIGSLFGGGSSTGTNYAGRAELMRAWTERQRTWGAGMAYEAAIGLIGPDPNTLKGKAKISRKVELMGKGDIYKMMIAQGGDSLPSASIIPSQIAGIPFSYILIGGVAIFLLRR